MAKIHLRGLGEPSPETREYFAFFKDWAGRSLRHAPVDDPAEADFILFVFGTDLRAPLTAEEEALLTQRPDDCFALDGIDRPIGFLPGLYAALPARAFDPARFRTYCYPVENRQVEAAWEARPEKSLFLSFLGGASSPLRQRLYRRRDGRSDILIEDTTSHQEWNPHQPAWAERKTRYAEVLARSEFSLCPRGAGVGSIRLFEAMQAGSVPVLLSDAYVLPASPGPKWDEFLIRLPESAAAQSDLPALLEPWREQSREMGLRARQAWETWFAPAVWLDRIVENLEAIRADRAQSGQTRTEASHRRRWPWWKFKREAGERVRNSLRRIRNRLRSR